MIKLELEVGTDFEKKVERMFYLISDKSINSVANIIAKDIEVNIAYGRSIYGGNVKPNRAKTRVLFKSGDLFRSVRNEKNNDSGTKGRVIFLDEGRAQIGSWLQYGTRRMVARPFFGISKITINKIDTYYRQLMINAEKNYLK